MKLRMFEPRFTLRSERERESSSDRRELENIEITVEKREPRDEGKKFPRESLTRPKDLDKSANVSISRRKRRADEHSGHDERHPDSGDFTVHRSSYKA